MRKYITQGGFPLSLSLSPPVLSFASGLGAADGRGLIVAYGGVEDLIEDAKGEATPLLMPRRLELFPLLVETNALEVDLAGPWGDWGHGRCVAVDKLVSVHSLVE